MIFNIIGFIFGVLLSGAGIYYLVKERADKESRKIYGIISGVGGVIITVMIVRIIVAMICA